MSAPNDQTSTPGDQPNAPAVSGGTENPRPNAEVDNEVQIAADVTDDQPAADGNIAAADAAAEADDQVRRNLASLCLGHGRADQFSRTTMRHLRFNL